MLQSKIFLHSTSLRNFQKAANCVGYQFGWHCYGNVKHGCINNILKWAAYYAQKQGFEITFPLELSIIKIFVLMNWLFICIFLLLADYVTENKKCGLIFVVCSTPISILGNWDIALNKTEKKSLFPKEVSYYGCFKKTDWYNDTLNYLWDFPWVKCLQSFPSMSLLSACRLPIFFQHLKNYGKIYTT